MNLPVSFSTEDVKHPDLCRPLTAKRVYVREIQSSKWLPFFQV